MIGIVSYGGYIPRLRLNRMSIYQQIGWLVPAVIMVAQGERSMCNWDEDSLTMAVAASRDCLKGMDKAKVDALYLASTTLPFADRARLLSSPRWKQLRKGTLWSQPPIGARPRQDPSTRCGSAMARPRCSWATKT
jgi:hypothetical protein